MMPPDSFTHQAVLYFFLMGMTGGAQASYSAHVVATAVAILCLMLPATLWFAFQDSGLSRAMAFGGIIYMAAAYRATRTLGYFVRHSFQLTYELRAANDHAQQLARTDGLTGLMNRRAFYEFARAVMKQAERSERQVSAVMLDLDHFKSINDTHGHALGDEVLKALARVITGTVRASDVAGRIGGEEFAVILPDTGVADAVAQAERLRLRTSEIKIPHNGTDIRVTCSCGVAGRDTGRETLDALLAHADAALYRAKHAGRNRVES
jgi:diguanylate cyclase (GGDEF)-like protein